MGMIKGKMSHKQQTELKQKIQSEKQRMEREHEIHVPYHKPKQYTLKEFLARKSINTISIENIKQGQRPVNSLIALKTCGEELQKFAQKIKEREEEALEFFKSDSESDEDDDSKPDENSVSIAPDAIPTSNEMLEEQVGETVPPKEDSMSHENELTAINDNANEDIELDNLREKYKNEPAEIETGTEKPTSKFSTLKTLREMGPNDVIDLESGLVHPRELTDQKCFSKDISKQSKSRSIKTLSI